MYGESEGRELDEWWRVSMKVVGGRMSKHVACIRKTLRGKVSAAARRLRAFGGAL